jgi:hypothetical protein
LKWSDVQRPSVWYERLNSDSRYMKLT